MTDAINESALVTPPTDTTPSSNEQVVNSEANLSDVDTAANTPESAPEETASPESESEVEPKRNRAQDRIEDLVAEKNAAKEYAEYWRLKALEIIQQERPQPPMQQQVPQVPVVSDVAPTLEDFQYDQAKWSRALAQWNAAHVKQEVARTLEAERVQSAQSAVTSQFQERVEAFKKDHPDFDVVMANPKLPQLDHIAAAMIVGSEHGADLAFTLAKNPDLATKISRMNSSQQALAIGRLESQVAESKKAPQVTPPPAPVKKAPAVAAVTKAPEPPTPIPAGGVPSPEPGSMDIKEWMNFRRQEARTRRRR